MSDGQPVVDGAPELNAQEQAALEVARNGLPPVDPNVIPGAPARPDSVPEKFWKDGKVDTDALLASYTSLESKLGAPAEGAPAAPAGAPEGGNAPGGKITKAEVPVAPEAPVASPVTALIEVAATEFTAEGKFTEETSASLEAAGIPVALQQVYLAGLQATAEKQEATVHGFVGGKDEYAAMSRWAGQHLTDSQLDAFNASLDNPDLAENAVRGLYSRFKSAKPNEGRLASPASNTAAEAGGIFRSRAEFAAALANPKYKADPVYRREVEEQLLRTRRAGITYN